MIEIPTLDEDPYDQQELEQLLEQYNRLSADAREPDAVSSEATIRIASHDTDRPSPGLFRDVHQLQLDLPIMFHENSHSPVVSLPQLVNMSNSPMAVDLYFLAQKQRQDYPETTIAEEEAPPQETQMYSNGHTNGSAPEHVPQEEGAIYENTRAFMITPIPTQSEPSAINLELSDYARELELDEQDVIDAQEVEYLSATMARVVIPTEIRHPLSQSTGAPEIDHEAEMDNASYAELEVASLPNEGNIMSPLELDMAPKSTLFLQFASPSSPAANRMQPSPQLPPPLSTKSLKLAFIDGEEFSLMRKVMATELKNPAEYTLHILFTQFVRHAERKLNLCLDYPLLQEPPIIELLAEGVDPHFDNIIASLGYIAKRKPRPIIDSVMVWRKSKGEVAAMAASEVEKIMALSKTLLPSSADQSLDMKNTSAPAPLPKANAGRGKRSLSLMRSKSLSKMAHRRNVSASVVPSAGAQPSAGKDQSSSSPRDSEVHRQQLFFDELLANARETAIQAERKSLTSIYILCRVLIEVVRQTSIDAMGSDLGGKLEEMVYNQLKTTDPITTSESFVRLANWNLFAELLGFMSEKRFLSVSDRFIADLEKVPINVKHEEEPKLHLLIHGMRYLKLTNFPLENFEESAEFVQSLTKFFCNSRNHTITFAYAEVLSNLILPLASVLTAEANHPLWVEAITRIWNEAYKLWLAASSTSQIASGTSAPGPSVSMHSNTDWDTSLILMTSALSVSLKEFFSENWFQVIEANAHRLKPKVDVGVKTKIMVSTSRLVWVYIYRLPDTLNNTIKKLDRLFEILFFGTSSSNKKQLWIVLELNLINSIAETIRICGFQHFNYILDNVILKLLRTSFTGSTQENFFPEKLILVVKSYMLCLRDYILGEKPEFPTDEFFNHQFNDMGFITPDKNFKTAFEIKHDAKFQKWNKLMFDHKRIKNYEAHEEICRTFSSLLKLLDNQCGVVNWTNSGTAYANQSYTKSFSSLSTHFGLDFYQGTKDIHVELFATLIDASAWSIAPLTNENSGSTLLGMSFKGIVELLVRNSIHENPAIASAAVNALVKLASRKSAGTLLTTYARIAFKMTEKPGPTYDAEYFSSESFIRLLHIYVELLKCWLHQSSEEYLPDDKLDGSDDNEMMKNDVLNDLYQINRKAPDLTNLDPPNKLKPYEELEWKTIITVIEEVEGNGLFFLCSDDSRIRLFAISILKIVEQFDSSIYKSTGKKELSPSTTESSSVKGHSRTSSKYVADEGTRLIHVIENADLLELLKPLKKELSVPEKSRLSKIKSKKGVILKFAASDYGIDSTIWFRIFPHLLDIFFEKCPMPVALCRSIVCVRLVQMHEIVVEFSESYKHYTSSIFGRPSTSIPPEVLVNQWKLYLIFACCSLTSTNEQKISLPQQPTHGRKKSLPMFIQHQKITSAKSVFRMVLPLLKSLQPMIRDAVISGLSAININICKTLTENLPNSISDWDMALKKRDPGEDRVRIEVVHILSILTSRFKSSSVLYSDDLTVANLVSIIKNVKAFLTIQSIQTLPEFQRLRIYFSAFLENVFIGLKEKLDLNRWLPFEARIGCFNFLQEWSGFGESKAIVEERYATMTQKAQLMKEPTTAVAILELEKKTLQNATLSCMATICSGALKQSITLSDKTAVISFDIKSVMRGVYEIVSSDNVKMQEIGQTALRNILSSNINNDEIYQEVLSQCYRSENTLKVKEVYYTNLVFAFLKFRQAELMPYDLFCLSTFLVGIDNHEIRRAAIKCIKSLEMKFFKTSNTDRFTESVCCSTLMIYKKVIFEISVQLAASHSKDAFIYISYLTKYFNVVDNFTRRDILASLLPWVQSLELKYHSNDSKEEPNEGASTQRVGELDTPSLMVLSNLFEITVKFSKVISNEVEALWVALGTNPKNFDITFSYLIKSCLERKNSNFVSYSRQIIAYLVLSKPDSSKIIDGLVENLQPKAMVPQQTKANASNSQNEMHSFPYMADLGSLLPQNPKDSAFSLGQMSMILLVDLLRSNTDLIVKYLPLLLHVCFSLLDHYIHLVREQAASLVIYLIHAIAPSNPKSTQVIESLRNKDHHAYLWVYDDLNNDKKGGMTPKNMDSLVRSILEIFTPSVPTLQDEWSRVSLKWATTCAVRHIACRSFQLFRSLLSFLDQNMLKDMLNRLSNTIADDSTEIQGFAMQILMTLNAITAELDSEKLIDFPQLFWSSVACLGTIHEHEFIETISTMSKFVSKIDLDAPDTISCLITTFPPKWEGKFDGLQQIVMTGLRSATAWEPTFKFLDRLNRLRDSEIIGSGDQRLFIAIIANFPRFLHALDQKNISPEIEETCNLISEMASGCDKPALARILNSLSKNRFRSKKDFLVQTISSLRSSFFPEYEAQALVLLLSFLSNKIRWVKLESLNILKHIFPLVDLQREEFLGVGADLISPLLRLLLTEFAEPALEVIDEAAVISGSQLDKDILRMSMGNTSLKKEFEQTATLFGIADDSGWAIPMPAVTAARTRHNVHAVFATCGEHSTVVDEKRKDSTADEDIQFLMEDYYAPPSDYGDTASVGVEEPAPSLSNMWAALDDFDSFFTRPSEQRAQHSGNLAHARGKRHHVHSLSMDTNNSNSSDLTSPNDSVPQVYDKKALFILNRSLARTQSNTSFKSGLADNFGSPSQYGQVQGSVQKRSYLPFRNSRLAKSKGDGYSTPRMNSSGTSFEQNPPTTPSKSSLKTSPRISTIIPNSPQEPMSPNSTNPDGIRFENLLSAGRKWNKKP